VQKAGFGGRCTQAGPNLAAWRTWSFGLELDEAHVPRAADLRAHLPRVGPRPHLPRAIDPCALHLNGWTCVWEKRKA
jgi:hypothetical protein